MAEGLIRVVRDPRISVPLRLVVGAAFVWAGLGKIADPVSFSDAIVNYRLVPAWMITPMAATLPALEIVAGACLIVGLFARGAALVASGLLGVFTVAIVQAIVRGINVDCGCFGAGSEAAAGIGWREVVRDLALLAAAAHVVVYDRGILSVERLRHRLERSSS